MAATASTATPAGRWWSSPDGLRLHARDYPGAEGSAKLPVIAIHGLTRNSRDFESVAPYIAASGRRVLALDVRGRGLSDRDPQPMRYLPPTYAGDVLALMAQLGIAQAVFLGTSMGGLITMAIAVSKPKMIAGAILNDVGPEVGKAGLMRIAGYAGQPGPAIDSWDDAADYSRRTNAIAFPDRPQEFWDAFARRCFREDAAGKPVLDYDPDISAPIRAAGPKALTPNLWPFFNRLARHAPTLLVRGETSDILDSAIAEKMRRKARTMAYAEVPGVGHAPMLDEPEAKAAILEFLARVP
ncbi:MAG: alpha/beta hydrolase [Caulobacteraceae bacterium]|nr:alpha/beta hydrolase [Caulobacteraceae bacterium]